LLAISKLRVYQVNMREAKPWLTIVLSIVSVILILIASYALWQNTQIFNSETFSKKTARAIQSQQARDAIASEIIEEAFADFPIINQLVGDFAQSAVSGLLKNRAVEAIIESFAEEVNMVLTSNKPKEISIDISGIVDFLKPIVKAADPKLGAELAKIDLPDSIVLAKKGDIPSLYSLGVVMFWLGPVAGIGGIGLIVALIWVANKNRKSYVLKVIGLVLAIGSLIFLFFIGSLESTIVNTMEGENLRTIADSVYDSLAGRLKWQTWILIVLGVISIILGYWSPWLRRSAGGSKKQT